MLPAADHKPSQKQADFVALARAKQVALFRGGLQSGKSVAGAEALGVLLWVDKVQLPAQTAGQMLPEVWILSRSYAMVQTAIDYFKWLWGRYIYDDATCRRMGLKRGDANTYWLDPGGRPDRMPIRLTGRTTSDPEELRAKANLLAALCDETAHWQERAWLNLSGRAVVTRTRFLLPTTPHGKNWLYKHVHLPAVEGDERTGEVHCRSADSPWADQAWIARLRKAFGEQYAAQELDAEFTAFEGQVYDWDEAKVLCDAPALEEYERVVLGVDPGWRDPYAVGFWGRREGVWYLADELYLTGKTTEDMLREIAQRRREVEIDACWVDPHRPEDIAILRKELPAKPARQIYAEKERLQIRPGIQLVQWLLNEGRIKVDRRCSAWIEEAYKYSYPDREEKNRGENPVDWANHACDAMRYFAVSEEGRAFAGLFPRYRMAGDEAPQALRPKPKGVLRIPTLSESIAFQDKAQDDRLSLGYRRGMPVARRRRPGRFLVRRREVGEN